MHVIVAGATGRAILGWEPLLDFVEAKGGSAGIVLTDPGAADDVEWPAPARARWKHIVDPSRQDAMQGLTDALVLERPDAVLLATDLQGLEGGLHAAMHQVPQRPAVVGAQHGFFQDWGRYKQLSGFDAFLTYGPFFQAAVADDPRFVAAALPKVDRIRHRPPTRTHGRVLLAPGTHFNPKLVELVLRLKEGHGLDVVVHLHPAARDLHQSLSQYDFVRFDRRSDLNEALSGVDGVITAGGTITLEALAAGRPVAVLPFQRGEAYDQAGIVADDFSPESSLSIFKKFKDDPFRAKARDFLAATTGSGTHNRSRIVYSKLIDIIKETQRKKASSISVIEQDDRDSDKSIAISDLVSGLGPTFFSIDQLSQLRHHPESTVEVLRTAYYEAIVSDRAKNWDGLYDKWVLFPHPSGPMLWLRLGDTVSHGIIRRERDDRITKFILSRLTPGGTFIDAGANAGWFTLRAAQAYKELGEGRVVAFEPQFQLYDHLLKSVEANGFGALVEVHRMALGDEDRSVRMSDGGRNSGGSFVLNDPAGSRGSVPMRRLDDLPIPVKSRVDCMKLDIEGAEPLFAAGARDFIRRHRPSIVSEVNTKKLRNVSRYKSEDYIRLIEDMGYKTCVLKSDAALRPFERSSLETSRGVIDVVFEPLL